VAQEVTGLTNVGLTLKRENTSKPLANILSNGLLLGPPGLKNTHQVMRVTGFAIYKYTQIAPGI
jgi:hypothetical protein